MRPYAAPRGRHGIEFVRAHGPSDHGRRRGDRKQYDQRMRRLDAKRARKAGRAEAQAGAE